MRNYASREMAIPISEIMSKHLITVHVEDSIRKAYQMMVEKKIRHLPAVDDTGQVVGILSDRDVKRAMLPKSGVEESAWDDTGTEFYDDHRVCDFMNWPVKSVEESCTVLDTARIMLSQKLSAMLVVSNHEAHQGPFPKGIVTTDDFIKLLVNLLSDKDPGTSKKLVDVEFLNKVL